MDVWETAVRIIMIRFVIAYDCPDDQRRRRIARLLEQVADRVQYLSLIHI